MTIELSRDAARQFLVARHGLAPPRALPAKPHSVLTAVERLGVLQFDPLEVPGARNHDLVLHSRIRGYRRDWCDLWLYGDDRRLFEIYNKSLNIVPMAELPHYSHSWTRYVERYSAGVLTEHADVVKEILAELKKRGPLTTADFAHHSYSVDWWWAPTRAARAILEALFVIGRVGISRRAGNRRHYDLIERIVPPHILKKRESPEEATLHRLLSRFRAVGLTSPQANAEVIVGTGKADERQRLTEELVNRGQIIPVQIQGLRGTRYAIATEKPLLDAAAKSGATTPPGVAFLAPLDPFVWDRKLLKSLFDYDYIWEVYVPEHKRRWGYYVLPILFGDRLVGRIEPRLDRATKTLRVLGLWWEDGFRPRSEVGLVDAMRDALRDYAAFVGANSVEWLPATSGAGRLFGSIIRRGNTSAPA
ncbi:MAG TPA: crosslink repair DNA glycosylase YcaQ family protein [Candidatus Limnocylindria bacterium]|nr:crosslink repair DNA glycosylase YcaQ family protein [Candidatus Limnocylindria bacterium]